MFDFPFNYSLLAVLLKAGNVAVCPHQSLEGGNGVGVCYYVSNTLQTDQGEYV